MIDKQNEFYSSISKYYDEIFPFNPAQLNFIKQNTGELKEKQILDIGCATGELSFHLAVAGSEVIGIDLNNDLLNRAKSEKRHPGLTFHMGNMLELESHFHKNQFDAVLCFGNTLVHLPDSLSVLDMLKGVRSVLKSGGVFLLQILNYDYVLSEKVTELPVIETENIKFIRTYKIDDNNSIIRFKTRLQIKNGGTDIENETSLLALRSNELKVLIKDAGFGRSDFFSNFKGEQFGGHHLPLVVRAK